MNRMLLALPVAMLLAGCSGSPPRADGATASPSRSTSFTPAVGAPMAIGSLEGHIVFSDETNDIWSMRANGTRVRRLTSAPAQEFDPSWSPDGSRIVFSSARDDCSVSNRTDCRSTNDIGPWEDVSGQFFAWSPDGSAILVAGAADLFLIRPTAPA